MKLYYITISVTNTTYWYICWQHCKMSRCMFLHVSLFGQSPEAEEITFNFPSLQVSGRSSCFLQRVNQDRGGGQSLVLPPLQFSSCNTENFYFNFSLIFSPADIKLLNYGGRRFFQYNIKTTSLFELTSFFQITSYSVIKEKLF